MVREGQDYYLDLHNMSAILRGVSVVECCPPENDVVVQLKGITALRAVSPAPDDLHMDRKRFARCGAAGIGHDDIKAGFAGGAVVMGKMDETGIEVTLCETVGRDRWLTGQRQIAILDTGYVEGQIRSGIIGIVGAYIARRQSHGFSLAYRQFKVATNFGGNVPQFGAECPTPLKRQFSIFDIAGHRPGSGNRKQVFDLHLTLHDTINTRVNCLYGAVYFS